MDDLELAKRCLEHLPNPSLSYDAWFRVIAAAHHVSDGSQMRDAAMRWSAKSSKHDEAFAAKTWGDIRDSPGRASGLSTIATLVHLARQSGYDPYRSDCNGPSPRRQLAAGAGLPSRFASSLPMSPASRLPKPATMPSEMPKG